MPHESEYQTRKRRIDARLKAMTPPWQIIRHQDGQDCARLHGVAVEEYPTENGPADYALFVHGQLLGIIEAKKIALDPYNVLATMTLLRNPEFQELLLNYQRAPRPFWIGYDVQDTVDSERLFRVGNDNLKPVDYIEAFARFVCEHREEIDGLSALLDRPDGWNPEVLDELRTKLGIEGFSEPVLREAHKVVYHTALADIISMVKHAARQEEPLLTAEQRVDRALQRVTAGRYFNEPQREWFGYIRERLALMNLYLHGVEPHIVLGDTIYEPPERGALRLHPHQPAFRHQGREPGPGA